MALRHDHVVDVVRPCDIAYAESDRRHVIVHARAGDLRVYGKLSQLEVELPAWFARCHQSYLINLDYVARPGSESVRLVTGVELPVSRRWRPAFKEALFSRVRRGLL
ncbi:LytR/AlgR family response regulator transcription factor [Thermophilibacter sp.]